MSSFIDQVHEGLTQGLIEENERDIVFVRHVKQQTSAGGFTTEPSATLSPQEGRLVLGSKQIIDRTLPEGRVVSPDGIIILHKGADVQRRDKTRIDDRDYEVVFVTETPWSVHAEVVRHGG